MTYFVFGKIRKKITFLSVKTLLLIIFFNSTDDWVSHWTRVYICNYHVFIMKEINVKIQLILNELLSILNLQSKEKEGKRSALRLISY